MKRLILTFGFLLPAIYFLYQASQFALFTMRPAHSSYSEPAPFVVQKGQSPLSLTRALVEGGFLEDSKKFIWLGKLTRQWKNIKAGEYLLSGSMTPIEIFSLITSGISVNHSFTVREGANMFEIAADLEKRQLGSKTRFIELCRDPEMIQSLGFSDSPPSTLEGYLFPDTYHINRTLSEADIIRIMHRRFMSEWGVNEDKAARALGMTRHEVVILASMIEKETGAEHERPIISSVFHNRLKKRMRLQSDPTTIYGIWERYTGNLRKTDLKEANPYNTYHVAALPVGPISNPGKEAIHAALKPASTSYLFFVSKNDGTHEFTETLRDHQAAVQKFQLDRKAREGKSWRDLHKKSQSGRP